MRKLILIFAAVLFSFSETSQAQAPPGWEALHLKTTTLADCTVHYEPVFEPDLPQLETQLKKFLAPADTRRPPIDPNEVVAEVNRLIGPSDWKPSEQKKLFETFYRNFLADTRWTFFLVTQKSSKDFLRAGGRLPNLAYDKKTDTVTYRIALDSQHSSEVEITLPLKSPDDIAGPLDSIFSLINQFARQTDGPSIALHELVEMSILRRVKLQGNGWRWFHDGMANALAGRLLKQYRIPFELLHDPNESADLEKQCNLQYWPYLKYEPFGNNSPIKAEQELMQARYAFAGREANYLLEKHGEGCVRKILDEMATTEGPRGQVLLAAIQKVTGEDFAPRLARYQDFATREEGIEKYTEALQAATKAKDLDQAISCQFRLMELRPDPFDPDNLRSWRETAMSLARQGRVEDGERLINQCVEIFQDSPIPEGKDAAQQFFFSFMLATDQPSKAVKYANELLAKRPDHLPSLMALMRVDVKEGRLTEAQRRARDILNLKNLPQAERRVTEQVLQMGGSKTNDYVEAVKQYRKAAEQNDADAQFNLASCYATGQGVAKDYKEAVKWCRKAAEQNHAKAQLNLGNCYRKGQGVAKDYKEAVKWCRKAAEQNDAKAQFTLGNCYRKGLGVAKDEVEAAKWWRKAAEQNHAAAQFNLGCCYATGQGVAKDYVEAYKWFSVAARQGGGKAAKAKNKLVTEMTPEQISEGIRREQAFKPRGMPLAGDDSLGAGFAEERPEPFARQESGVIR